MVTVSLCVSVLAAPAATDFGARVRTAVAVAASANIPRVVDCDPLPPGQLDRLISGAAIKEGLPPELVRAVIQKESASQPCVVSPKGARGLMQLMPETAAHFGVLDPFDPTQNVYAGAKFLKQLLTRYNGDLPLALSAYNGGPPRADRDPPVETLAYVSDIVSEISKE